MRAHTTKIIPVAMEKGGRIKVYLGHTMTSLTNKTNFENEERVNQDDT